ncbi:hypothetical protein evm_008933 [Chilo suppressalis]|nr:hypothetical protein evm_008933 [Chilo suppressalis]
MQLYLHIYTRLSFKVIAYQNHGGQTGYRTIGSHRLRGGCTMEVLQPMRRRHGLLRPPGAALYSSSIHLHQPSLPSVRGSDDHLYAVRLSLPPAVLSPAPLPLSLTLPPSVPPAVPNTLLRTLPRSMPMPIPLCTSMRVPL